PRRRRRAGPGGFRPHGGAPTSPRRFRAGPAGAVRRSTRTRIRGSADRRFRSARLRTSTVRRDRPTPKYTEIGRIRRWRGLALWFQMSTPPYAWHNGELVAWQDCVVHVRTQGAFWGANVCEGLRGYWTGHAVAIFRLDEHLARLRAAMKREHMRARFADAEL